MNETNQENKIYQRLVDFGKCSRVVKTAHFNSAQRKQKTHRVLGVFIIVINILITSPLINLIFSNNPDKIGITVKFLAIISASLASIQTLFNWQKEADKHLTAGDSYTNIYHKASTLLAKFEDKLIDIKDLIVEFESLQNEYLEVNKNYQLSIPSDYDFKKAKEKIKERTSS